MPTIRRSRAALIVTAAALCSALVACTPSALPLPPPATSTNTTPTATDVRYGGLDEQALDIYATDATARLGTLVYLHGGGWTAGIKESLIHPDHDRILAQRHRGWDVVSVRYRLAPAHPFPAAFDDAALAVDWVRAEGATHGLHTGRVVVVGHSAGGSLAAMIGTSPGATTAFGVVPRVDAWVAIAAISAYAAGGTLADYPGNWGLVDEAARIAASPITTIGPGDPPGHLVHGDLDGFVQDWHSVILAAHGRALGADVELDRVTTGTEDCRRHAPVCGMDLERFEAFVDGR